MELDFSCGGSDPAGALKRLQRAKAQAAVTQAERAVLEAAKAWFSPDGKIGSGQILLHAIRDLEEAEKERDALNASTVGEGR